MTCLKSIGAILDFAFDWRALTHGAPGAISDWLETTETITAFSVSVSAGLTKGAVSEATGKVVVWLSGGTVGQYYSVTCSITTSLGRTDERTMTIYVTER